MLYIGVIFFPNTLLAKLTNLQYNSLGFKSYEARVNVVSTARLLEKTKNCLSGPTNDYNMYKYP